STERRPPARSTCRTLLAEQCGRRLATIHLSDTRDPAQLERQLQRATAEGAELVVVDAMTDEELAAIVTAAERALPDVVFVGSAGLVGALATHSARQFATPMRNLSAKIADSAAPILAVIGSGSVMAQEQLASVRRDNRVVYVELSLEEHRPNPLSSRGSIDATRCSVSRRHSLARCWMEPRPGAWPPGWRTQPCSPSNRSTRNG
ncbi:MAG: four-carbon acid sugar kinase family protein, partial [Caldilineaceae bacterium]|nr:four-carbon acid sugar kinase family protein [Caldilineaceae bacterium]